MTLFTTIWAYKTELILLLFFSAPIVYPLCLHRPSRPPINIIILHTLYFLSHLVYSPYDLFAHLPILTPNLVLQQTLDTSPLAQLLLQKLQSLDNRYYYARFGHHTLAQCVWCHNIYDYLLFSIPGIIAPYLVTAIAIGISKWVGEPNATGRANRWRATFGWSLLCLAIGECGIKYGWDVRVVSGDCLNLYSTIHILRSILLILVLLAYVLLPVPPRPNLVPTLVNAQNTLRLASLSRTAISRDPRLRRIWIAQWEEESQASRVARAQVVEPPHIRQSANQWVRDGWKGLIRVS